MSDEEAYIGMHGDVCGVSDDVWTKSGSQDQVFCTMRPLLSIWDLNSGWEKKRHWMCPVTIIPGNSGRPAGGTGWYSRNSVTGYFDRDITDTLPVRRNQLAEITTTFADDGTFTFEIVLDKDWNGSIDGGGTEVDWKARLSVRRAWGAGWRPRVRRE